MEMSRFLFISAHSMGCTLAQLRSFVMAWAATPIFHTNFILILKWPKLYVYIDFVEMNFLHCFHYFFQAKIEFNKMWLFEYIQGATMRNWRHNNYLWRSMSLLYKHIPYCIHDYYVLQYDTLHIARVLHTEFSSNNDEDLNRTKYSAQLATASAPI